MYHLTNYRMSKADWIFTRYFNWPVIRGDFLPNPPPIFFWLLLDFSWKLNVIHIKKEYISIDSIIVKMGFFLVLHEFSQGFRTRAIYNGEWGLLWEKGVLPVMVYVRPGRGCAVLWAVCCVLCAVCCEVLYKFQWPVLLVGKKGWAGTTLRKAKWPSQ